jgi:hypothetical protein
MKIDTLDTREGVTIEASPTSSELWDAVTKSVVGLMPCEAVEWKNLRSTLVLGTNKEISIIESNADGVRVSILWDTPLPEDIELHGRNISVTYFWDGSVRLETIQSANTLPADDGFANNGTRFNRSELTLTLGGETYNHHIVILDGRWGVQILAKQ